MNPQIEIEILEAPIKFGEIYTVILYFQDKNKNFLNNKNLPHGHRQNIQINEFPLKLRFDIKGNFLLDDVYIIVLIEKEGTILYGEQFGSIDTQELKITGVSIDCE